MTEKTKIKTNQIEQTCRSLILANRIMSDFIKEQGMNERFIPYYDERSGLAACLARGAIGNSGRKRKITKEKIRCVQCAISKGKSYRQIETMCGAGRTHVLEIKKGILKEEHGI